ncbi:hypothetical protein [Methylocystis rosea]|uniref:HNH endonuclease n=1 Tax=Methylocystis rosea TaxID=173366 RepID=A0A3G8M7A6_9HYPH|nr:hypothetical protein [Methylocystis rosea]AZG77175.1 hypothetical protein EHO51_10755 [Methylocystis rosea]
MNMIDLPDLKAKLWHQMRHDLKSLVPWFADNDLLLCPACCRPLRFDEFSLEHIIPQQALACDPLDVRDAVPRNERSGMTLMCRKPLVIKGRKIPGHGCNSWKGKFYDASLRDLIRADFQRKQLNSRHQIALFSAGYLALFRQFGYQIALLPSGLLMRNQFFHPNSFLRDVPLSCQVVLAGERLRSYEEGNREYWSEPFKITVDGASAFIVLRNMVLNLPLSRDPKLPLARALPYAPSKYAFRPDLRTAFE